MTVDVNDRLSGPYNGNGVTTAFAYDFLVSANTELRVILRDEDGEDEVQTLTTDYSVSGVGTSGGNVTFVTAPATGEKVIIEAVTPKTQTVEYTNNDRFPYDSHQAGFDKTQRQIQELQRDVDRAVKFAHGETVYRLPIKPASETKLLARNTDGEIIHAESADFGDGTPVHEDWLSLLGFAPSSVLDDLNGVRFAANYAELTALPADALVAGALYQVPGRVTADDGGAGTFRCVAGTALPANGGTILTHDTESFQFRRTIDNDCFVAGWFGATGPTLNTAVTAASGLAFPIFANPGTWTFAADESVLISSGVYLFGAGPGTILRASADRLQPVVWVTGASADNVTLESFRVETTFSGSPSVSQFNAGIVADGVDDVTIRNVEVEGKFYVGIMIKNCKRATIENVRVRGARNRQLYVFENCQDVTIDGVKLDCRDASDAVYGDYGLNINPGGTTSPRRLVVVGVTVQGYGEHGVSIAEDFESAVITGVTGETASTTAAGLLLQAANAKRGREFIVSDISMKGGGIPIQVESCDNLTLTNILASDGVGAFAQIFIHNSHDIQGANWQAIDGAAAGIEVYGDTADSCTDINVVGVTCEGNAGPNIFCDGGASNSVRRVTFSGINSHGAGTYGFRATASCEAVLADGGQISSSTTADYSNLSVNGHRRNLMLSGVLESPTRVVYTSSTTWTKADYPGLVAVEIVELKGGGGGGGGAADNNVFVAGAGGAEGGRSSKIILAASLGTTETVTIGAGGTAGADTGGTGGTGGTTSFGSHASATGGAGGVGNTGVGACAGGDGGVGSGGDSNLTGAAGQNGLSVSGAWAASGAGGGQGGGRGRATTTGTAAAGVAGANGGGGGGGVTGGDAAAAGGAGGAGYIVLRLYY